MMAVQSKSKPLIEPGFLAAGAATAGLLALAMPGITGWWPLLFVALIPLLSVIHRLSPRQSFCMGMFCGLLYYISLLYWIMLVLRQYGGVHTVFAAGALFMLALYMAVYTALFCLLLNLMAAPLPGTKNDSSIIIVMMTAPAVWVGLDFLRGYLFTGMPWMDLGYGLYRQPMLIQSADLGGHHLLTFCIVLINALLLSLLDRFRNRLTAPPRHYCLHSALVFLLLYCIGGYSVLRYRQVGSAAVTSEQAEVSVVQGNVDQNEKWSPELKEETVARYITLSGRSIKNGKKMDLIVWPETALPFYPPTEPLMNRVRDFAREEHIHLLTGSPYFTVNPEIIERPVEYFNSALMIDRSGKLTGRYNKQHLVPFGEYVPLRAYLWFVKPLVELVGDFTPGNSFEPLRAEKIKAGVLICFESIFPKIARLETAAGANLLVNMTNDAWYGRSSAPQHSWAMTVMRAVENRRSMVRATNTGISGFVEATGFIRSESPLFTAKALTESMPLMTELTIFTQSGHLFGVICLALILPLLLLGRKKIGAKTTGNNTE